MLKSATRTIQNSFAIRIIAGFLLAFVVLLIICLLSSSIQTIDDIVQSRIQTIASPSFTEALRIATQLGSTLVLFIVGAVAVCIFAALRRWREVGLFLLAMAGQVVLHYGFKTLCARERPKPLYDFVMGDSYSFPSGHALASLSVYGMLCWLLSRRLRLKSMKACVWMATFFVVFVIGFSRVYFNVHYASDVIAGFVAAFIWTAAVASSDTGS